MNATYTSREYLVTASGEAVILNETTPNLQICSQKCAEKLMKEDEMACFSFSFDLDSQTCTLSSDLSLHASETVFVI